MVRDVTSEAPGNRTLILNWHIPVPTNGDILHYTIKVTLNFNNDIVIIKENVMDAHFTTTRLSKLCCTF